MPTRHLIAVENRYWHFRQQGDTTAETAIVLLHTFPGDSAMFAPLFDELSALRPKMRLIAPDIPGYGGTDPLPRSPTSLQDYLPSFRAFFRELGLRQVIVYGTGSGAQFATAYSNAYPDKVASVFLDDALQAEGPEREYRLAYTFPDLTPQPDGSHLPTVWQLATNLLQHFPWLGNHEAHHVDLPPTPEQIQRTAVEIMRAGADYVQGYRAAIHYAQMARVGHLPVPTTLFRRYANAEQPDAPDQQELPASIQLVDTPSALSGHYKVVAERLLKGIKN
ncbi:alpha/beta fold hydrolase [Fibrella arboris]|uniref:alpha/beta fold hydrolase n=1 Tax=Fibrella arboris TaxID=3242486 RepID=UPI00351FA4EC